MTRPLIERRREALAAHFADSKHSFTILSCSPSTHGGAKVKAEGTCYDVEFGLSDPARITDVVCSVYNL